MPVPWVFTDPKNDPFNPLKYIANNTLSAIAICACLFSSALPAGCCIRVYTTLSFLVWKRAVGGGADVEGWEHGSEAGELRCYGIVSAFRTEEASLSFLLH